MKIVIIRSEMKKINAVKREWGEQKDVIAEIEANNQWVILKDEQTKIFIPREVFEGILKEPIHA